jgi:hypothetical protein
MGWVALKVEDGEAERKARDYFAITRRMAVAPSKMETLGEVADSDGNMMRSVVDKISLTDLLVIQRRSKLYCGGQ